MYMTANSLRVSCCLHQTVGGNGGHIMYAKNSLTLFKGNVMLVVFFFLLFFFGGGGHQRLICGAFICPLSV